MSRRAMVWAVRLPKSAAWGGARAVLGLLADYANEAGAGAYPSVRTIATHLEVSERSVQRYLEQLERDGLICRGDQLRAAGLRANRRPVVWDLVGLDGVTDLSPQEGRGVTDLSPQEAGGVTSQSTRGDNYGTSGVTAAVVETRSDDPTEETPPTRDARDATPARVSPEDGGELTPNERQAAESALRAIAGAMPVDRGNDIDPQWRKYPELLESIHALLAGGWRHGQLAEAVGRPNWNGLGNTTGALNARLKRLRSKPVPSSQPPRRPQWCTECDYARRLRYDEAGNPDPSQPCPVCHPDAVQLAAAGGAP